MSQENVDRVRRFYQGVERAFQAYWADPRSVEEAWQGGDVTPEGAELVRYVHPNVEWKTALMGISYRGYLGIARGWDQLLEAAQEYRIDLKEVADLGDEQVLAVVEAAMKGKSSNIAVESVIFTVVTVQEGQITQMDEYLERSEALKAAGLRE